MEIVSYRHHGYPPVLTWSSGAPQIKRVEVETNDDRLLVQGRSGLAWRGIMPTGATGKGFAPLLTLCSFPPLSTSTGPFVIKRDAIHPFPFPFLFFLFYFFTFFYYSSSPPLSFASTTITTPSLHFSHCSFLPVRVSLRFSISSCEYLYITFCHIEKATLSPLTSYLLLYKCHPKQPWPQGPSPA